MDSRIEFIQTQLWVLIALFALLVIANVACNIANRRRKKPKTASSFEDLWERGKLDELDAAASNYLRIYPNNLNARLFLAKSLTSQGRYTDALLHLEHLYKIEPSLQDMLKKMISALSERIAGS